MRHAVWSSLLLPALLGCSSASPQIAEPIRTASANKVIDLSTHFDGLEGAFVLYDQNAGTYLRHNPQRCALRLSPCSTFKIANTLIALDTNIATGADFVIPWDQQRDPEEPWWKELGLDWAKNHTLETAFRNSVVWYYREIARRIGQQAMGSYLSRFEYGNQDISGGIDKFWLSSTLRISADEQVEFLRRLHGEQLGVSQEATQVFEQIFLREQGEGYVLRAKTGSGSQEGEPTLGWLVGWVEAKSNVYFFALNVEGEDFPKVRDTRLNAAMSILREQEILPPLQGS